MNPNPSPSAGCDCSACGCRDCRCEGLAPSETSAAAPCCDTKSGRVNECRCG